VLHGSLKKAAELIQHGERNGDTIRQTIREMVNATPEAVLIYASVASGIDLSEMEQIDGDVVISLAAWFGSTRLIDNLILDTHSSR